jgi:hypothetical protein
MTVSKLLEIRENGYPEQIVRWYTMNRPIYLLLPHSKLFEKGIFERVRIWAEGAQLLPVEQSGFRPGGLLSTRVRSIYQEINNS